MKFLIEVGRLRSAKGWLARMEPDEALATVRELRGQGAKEIHIFETENFACISEATLARYVQREHKKH